MESSWPTEWDKFICRMSPWRDQGQSMLHIIMLISSIVLQVWKNNVLPKQRGSLLLILSEDLHDELKSLSTILGLNNGFNYYLWLQLLNYLHYSQSLTLLNIHLIVSKVGLQWSHMETSCYGVSWLITTATGHTRHAGHTGQLGQRGHIGHSGQLRTGMSVLLPSL